MLNTFQKGNANVECKKEKKKGTKVIFMLR